MNTTAIPPLETAVYVATIRGQAPGRWAFPVLTGCPRPEVEAEVRRRLTAAGQAAALDDLDGRLEYPAGPWSFEVRQDNPPIGLPPIPAGWWQDKQQPAPQQPQQQAGPQPTAPPTTPLPPDGPRQGTEQAVMAELDLALAQWQRRHQLTSAEFYMYLTSMLSIHGRQLVARERHRSRNG